MARITTDDVVTAMGTSLDATTILAFIDTASRIVDENLLDATLSDAVLTDIEKWLTCHFIALSRDIAVVQETVGDASVRYAVSTTVGTGLAGTPYGQQVIALDSSGRIRKLFLNKANLMAVRGPGYVSTVG